MILKTGKNSSRPKFRMDIKLQRNQQIPADFKSPTRHSPAKAARRAGSQRHGDGA